MTSIPRALAHFLFLSMMLVVACIRRRDGGTGNVDGGNPPSLG